MSEQKQADTLQKFVNDLLKGVHEKEGLAVSLLQMAAQERHLISLLPARTKQIPHSLYQPFLHQDCFLLLRVTTNQLPIWLSDNLQLADFSVLSGFEGALESNVHQLHDNLAKYESVIASLKELKEMQQLEREQQERSKDAPNRELKLKKYIETLEKQIFEAKSQIKRLTTEKSDLQAIITALEEKEKHSQQRRELQNRFKQCNDAALSEPPKRRHKKILINY